VELSPFTPLVGYNNAGKSNILLAIQWLVRGGILKEKDFFNDATNNTNEIICSGIIEGITETLLNGLGNTHKSKIEQFVDNAQLKIKRTQSGSEKPDLLVFDGTEWKKNPTGIDNAIKKLFPEPIRIGEMDNATEDVSKSKTSTTIGKLLNEFISPIKDEHETKLKPHFDAIQKSLSAQSDSRLSELEKFDASINEKIKDFFPDMSLKIDIKTPSFDEIFKDGGTIRVYENGNEGRDCSAYGHGAQRAIQMALIRHLADIKSSSNDSSPTTLLLIDEPELYLHPFAIEQTREALKTLSKTGYQVLFSTHSPQMITAEDAQHTLLIRKENHTTKIRKRLERVLKVAKMAKL
jgi:predicted ATP-dependent endonuclease of OLD family